MHYFLYHLDKTCKNKSNLYVKLKKIFSRCLKSREMEMQYFVYKENEYRILQISIIILKKGQCEIFYIASNVCTAVMGNLRSKKKKLASLKVLSIYYDDLGGRKEENKITKFLSNRE